MSVEGDAYIFNMETPDAEPSVCKGHEQEGFGLGWCQHAPRLATGSKDKRVLVWDITNASETIAPLA
jgi:hypothetical protein